jgi:hypothetical protein
MLYSGISLEWLSNHQPEGRSEKMKKILALLAAGLMVGAIIVGCSTEEPWSPEPSRPLDLVIVSAPDQTTDIPAYSSVNFVWSATGGSGNITYQWYLEPMQSSYGEASNLTSIAYDNLDPGSNYVFHVMASDQANGQDEATASFAVMQAVEDTQAPAITITMSPAEDSYVATGSNLAFAWAGDDGGGNTDMIMYQYAFPTMSDSSEWTDVTSVSYEDIASADPAMIAVRAQDQAGNISDWATVSFIIQPATILYIDDYQWLDANGNVDMPKEREQKQFYRNVLEGYAFAEWDMALQGIPDTSDLVDAGGVPRYSTVLYAADSELGSTSGNAWLYFGDAAYDKGYSMRYFLEQGGNLLLGGALALLDMTQAYPPDVLPGDFEFDWLGIDSTAWCFDYWSDFTWAVKDTMSSIAAELPDSMKIDVAKNGDQVDYAMETPGLRNEATVTTEVIYVWGLDIDGDPTYAYGHPLAHITMFDGTPRTALLNFDMFEMPEEGIQMTVHAILTEFGE